jgi:phage terminase Nu1 subunit (DNA packaging protein)
MTAEEWYAADIAQRQADLAFRQAQHAAWVAVNTASTAAQNARATAEQAVAEAGTAAANAQLAAAQALNAPAPAATDAQLLIRLIDSILAGGKVGGGVLAEAKAQLTAYRGATRPPTPAPK